MTWEVTDLGFRMGLSPRVPQVLSLHVRTLVDDLLARHGLTRGDVDGWAVHPGGPKILDVVPKSWSCRPTRSRRPGRCSPRTATARRRRCCSYSTRCAGGPYRPGAS